MNDQKEDHSDPESPHKLTVTNVYRPIMCLPMILKILTAQIREEIYYSLINHRLLPKEQRTCRGRTIRARELLYVDEPILNNNKTRGENVATAWFDYKRHTICPTKLDMRLCQNVRGIRRIHKVYKENNGKLESGIDSGRKKVCRRDNPERYLAGRCAITITICYSGDTSLSHTNEMHWWIYTNKIGKKISIT